jgi:hypothetical protein
MLAWCAAASAQTTLESFSVADGPVRSVTQLGGTFYLGGDFTTIGPALGSAAAFDPVTAQATLALQVVGEVHAAVSDGAGGWYIAGLGSRIRAQQDNLAHARRRSVAWNPGTDGRVRALARNGSSVYGGGHLTHVAGQVRNRIAAVDGGSGALGSWNPGADDRVSAIVASGSKLYVGGRFTVIGGQNRPFLAAIDAGSGVCTPWNAGADCRYTLLLQGSTLYAGGYFAYLGSPLHRFCLAAVDTATAQSPASWTSLGYPQQGPFYSLALAGSTLYAGGPGGVFGFDAASGVMTGFNAVSDGPVFALAVSGGALYAGGSFASLAGQSRKNLGALDPATAQPLAWNPGPNGPVLAIHSSVSILVGGEYTSAGGAAARLAAIDAATGQVTPWNPGADGKVTALTTDGTSVFLAGEFANVGGQPRAGLAALDPASGAAKAWNPNPDGPVTALAIAGGPLYVGGSFAHSGAAARSFWRRWIRSRTGTA